ncbi:retrovirus-related pol polyprotein from transposon TNT 1-94 [Tanacetum coccineum]
MTCNVHCGWLSGLCCLRDWPLVFACSSGLDDGLWVIVVVDGVVVVACSNQISEAVSQNLSTDSFDVFRKTESNGISSNPIKNIFVPHESKEKAKKVSHPPKPVPNSKQRLHLLHMDLYGPMRIASINGKRYVLVIVDDYSRYTWVLFLRLKDKAPYEIKTFLKKITILLQAPVIILRTDNGREFKNQVLQEYFNSFGISHQASSVRTPHRKQEKAIATACYTQNHSIIHCRFDKTPYELINGKKLDISFLYVFEALCYPKNDREDIGKLAMYDDHIGGQPSATPRTIPAAQAPQVLQTSTEPISIAETAPTPTNSSSQATSIPSTSQNVDELETHQQHVQHQPATIANNVSNATFDEIRL